ITGWNFAPGAEVEVWMRSTPVLLTTVVADGRGTVSSLVTIPRDAASGHHRLVLVGDGRDRSPTEVVLSLTVREAGTLPATGGGFGWTVGLLAALLILAGSACIAGVRRPAAVVHVERPHRRTR
ncbi:MAG: hypothetical protein ACLGHQ_10105, partial [Acidimicrobiia bacterium]